MTDLTTASNVHADALRDTPRLILVFGLPRSGTTWLGKIFDSHPATLYRHEPDARETLAGIPLLAEIGDADQFREIVERFVGGLAGLHSARVCAKRPLFPKSYYTRTRFTLFQLAATVSKFAGRASIHLPVYPFANLAGVPDLRVVWKSVGSVGRLGSLVRILPEARAVFLIRHPCGYVASILRGEARKTFGENAPIADDDGIFSELLGTQQARRLGLRSDDLNAMHPVERLAWCWALYNDKSLDDIRGLENCRVVRYEDMCANAPEVTRTLFRHVDLLWSDQTATFIEQSTTLNRENFYSVFKNPAQSVNRWRRELTKTDVDRILAVTKLSESGRLFLS